MLNIQNKKNSNIIKIQKNKHNEILNWVDRVAQISRVIKVCKGKKRFNFRVVMIVGNRFGQVGVGVGKSDNIVYAIPKGILDAKKNLINISTVNLNTISDLSTGIYGACQVFLKPASLGTGLIAGSSIRTVLELAGIKNILTKQLGTKNILNNAKATIAALNNLKTTKISSQERNLVLKHFYF